MNQKQNILIVDDEPDILKSLETILSHEGYKIKKATNGLEAIEIFNSESIDLVITDLKMPGMDGAEVVKQVRQLNEEVMVLILTGHATLEKAIQTLRDNMAYDFLTKPIDDIDKLLNSIRQALEKRSLIIENRVKTVELTKLCEKLKESEKRYSTLIDKMLNGFALHELIFDKKGKPFDYRFLKVNQAFTNMTGLRPDEVIGKTALEVLPGLESFWIETYSKVALTGEPIWLENYLGPLGDYFEVLAYCPKENQFATVFTKTTERKLTEQALADSERRLADIIEFLPDPTWVIDIDGRVIAWNRSMEEITGIKKKDILGKGDYAYSVPFYGKRRPVLIDLVLKRDPNWEKEYLTIKENDRLMIEGETFHPLMGDDGLYLAGTASRLFNTKGDVIGAIETIRDISASIRSAKEREQLILELRDAIAKVRTLSGMLPICANCKKIRDDQGYWNQLEDYILDHSDAEFSHGICPECAKELYPDLHI